MKRKIWTITPYFLAFSAVILCMAIYSIRWNIYIFIAEMIVAVATIVFVYFNLKYFEKYINKVVHGVLNGIKGVNVDYLEKFNIPVVVAGNKGDIVWYNKHFKTELCNGRSAEGDFISQYISNIPMEDILDKDGVDVAYCDKRYTVLAYSVENGAVLYFIDDTYYKQTAEEYKNSRPAIAMIAFDNWEEFERDGEDDQSSHVLVSVENALQKWAAKYNGMFKKLMNGKYLVVLEERNIKLLIDEKFSILKEIRSMKFNVLREATISIGIGRGASGFRECDLWARKALDMALGRGGDQAAVKDSDTYQFFGGVSKGVEKLDKVRTRVIATTLTEHIRNSDHVLIMGHRFSDLDCVGASVGLWSAVTKGLSKPSHVVLKKEQSLALPLIDAIESAGSGNMFMRPEEALNVLSDKTLLIIVDTHSPSFVESEELYQKAKNVVVIDHHRMMVNHISNSLVFFHEPYASSASEMATELVQYMSEDALNSLEAEALLAGITLDTKNFVLKTGVRTFEAAAYLRQKGADTIVVKRLFSNSIDTYKAKYKLVSDAEIFNKCAIACADEKYQDVRVTAAQAADELLCIQGVKASFVLFKEDNAVNISARSLGDINVQVIMEKLDGGGHQTMAGAQIKNSSLSEAREKLINIIKDMEH